MIWTWLKNGEPRGFFKDEHSLLVSYDMMPLLGLDEMRHRLNHEGEIAVGHLVIAEGTNLFVPFRNGEPDVEVIDWGCCCKTYTRCLRCLCFFASFAPDEPRRNRMGISLEDNAVLREHEWRMCSDDGRHRRPLPRLQPLAEAILLGLGFQIEPVRFVASE